MRYNDNSIEIEVVTDVTIEPVTSAEVKRALRLQFDTDGSYEFDDDDTLIADIIKAARETIENYTGLSLAPKTLKAVVRNELGNVEIPCGPHTVVSSIVDQDGSAVDYVLRGNQFKTIETPWSCYMVVSFQAGYAADKLPQQLRRAIIEEFVWRYSNSGDQQQEYAATDTSLCNSSLNLAAPFKRKSILV